MILIGKVLLTTGGRLEKIQDVLGIETGRTTILPFVKNTPTITVQEIEQAILDFQKSPAPIVAVGGGKVIDMAKILASHFNVRLEVYPTTLGSGSEETGTATVYVGRHKISKRVKKPDNVIYNEALIRCDNDKVLRDYLSDGLVQSVESLFSVRGDDESRFNATVAGDIYWGSMKNLSLGYDPSWEELALASSLVGKAINKTSTGLCHVLSYYFTGYHGMNHGQAVMAAFPTWLRFNLDKCDWRTREAVSEIFSKWPDWKIIDNWYPPVKMKVDDYERITEAHKSKAASSLIACFKGDDDKEKLYKFKHFAINRGLLE